MNTLLIINVEVLVLSKWSYRSTPIILTFEPQMVSISFEHVRQSIQTRVFFGAHS
jgi:hypothetical protein